MSRLIGATVVFLTSADFKETGGTVVVVLVGFLGSS
jgi:hypothetical protein